MRRLSLSWTDPGIRSERRCIEVPKASLRPKVCHQGNSTALQSPNETTEDIYVDLGKCPKSSPFQPIVKRLSILPARNTMEKVRTVQINHHTNTLPSSVHCFNEVIFPQNSQTKNTNKWKPGRRLKILQKYTKEDKPQSHHICFPLLTRGDNQHKENQIPLH